MFVAAALLSEDGMLETTGVDCGFGKEGFRCGNLFGIIHDLVIRAEKVVRRLRVQELAEGC